MPVRQLSHVFDLVVFDLDGTLADTMPLVLEAFNHVFQKYAGFELTLPELVAEFGPPEGGIIAKYVKPGDHPTAVEEFYRVHRDRSELVEPFPGIRSALDEMRKAGLKMAVYTGAGRRSALLRLEFAGLLGHFDRILGGDDVRRHKPHPEGLQLLLDEFGCSPDRAVYVGDSPSDIRMAQAAGVAAAAVAWGVSDVGLLEADRPDFVLRSPEELVEQLVRCGDGGKKL